MDDLAISIGQTVCQLSAFFSAPQAQCYDVSAMRILGYGLVFIAALAVLVGKGLSRTTG
jgi:hypothetical protein